MSTEKKPVSRRDCNKMLEQAMYDRQEKLGIIAEAKRQVQMIEEEMIIELVRQRRTDCLNINWKAVRRVISF